MIAFMIAVASVIWPIALAIVVGGIALALVEGWLEASEPRRPRDWRRSLRCYDELRAARRPRVELTRNR